MGLLWLKNIYSNVVVVLSQKWPTTTEWSKIALLSTTRAPKQSFSLFKPTLPGPKYRTDGTLQKMKKFDKMMKKNAKEIM